MSENSCNCNSGVMILACSGGSNVGQLSNQASVELTREGSGNLFCLAGIGGNLSGFVQSARDASMVVIIDGCEIGCAGAVLKQAEVPVKNYLVITDLGIKKNKDLTLKAEDITSVKSSVREMIRSSAT